MRKLFIIIFLVTSAFAISACDNTKVTIKVVDESGDPLQKTEVRVGFERNDWGTVKVKAQRAITKQDGLFNASGRTNGHIMFSGKKEGYYWSSYSHDFVHGNEPWNKEFNIVMRKIEEPVPMYARNTKMSEIIIPVIDEPVGFDLINFDWVSPYGAGEDADFYINLKSDIENFEQYNFTASISFTAPNGLISYKEDTINGSQFILPRFAPKEGYSNSVQIFDRVEKGKDRIFSRDNNQHYIFRTRAELDKDGNLFRAMYGKVIGDIYLHPLKDGKANLIFKYYLNPDYTRNLEFDPKRNLFGELPSFERVGIR